MDARLRARPISHFENSCAMVRPIVAGVVPSQPASDYWNLYQWTLK